MRQFTYFFVFVINYRIVWNVKKNRITVIGLHKVGTEPSVIFQTLQKLGTSLKKAFSFVTVLMAGLRINKYKKIWRTIMNTIFLIRYLLQIILAMKDI